MDVRCEKCQAEYTLDETLVSPTGTAVRCTTCGHVFRVVSKASADGAQATWILRQVNGATVPFDRMSLLQDWIAKGIVSREDMISRGGREWRRLADLAEMKPFFDAADLARASRPGTQPVGAGFPQARGVDAHQPTVRQQAVRGDQTATQRATPTAPMVQIQSQPPGPGDKGTRYTPSAPPPPAKAPAAPAPMATPIEKSGPPTVRAHSPSLPFAQTAVAMPAIAPAVPPPPARPQGPPKGREPDLSMSQVPAAAEERWEAGRAPRVENPAWTSGQPHFAAPIPDDDEDAPPPKRHVGRWVALAIVVALVGAGFYVFMYRPELVRAALGRFIEKPADTRYEAFFLKGRESFLLDAESAFMQADREYHKVLALDERHAPTLAALAEMYAVWAQYIVDQQLDARVDAAVAKGSEPHLRELSRLKNDFDHKLADARRWGSQALAADPALPAAHLAMADVLRLGGDLAGAEEHLSRAGSPETADAKAYVAALVALQKGAAPEELLEPIRRVAHSAAEPMLRAQYREARILAAGGKVAEAKEVLAKLLEVNSDHDMGRDLAARIDAGRVVVLTGKGAEGEEQRLASAAVPEVVAPPPPPSETPEKPAAGAEGGGAGGGAGGFAAGGTGPDAMLAKAAKLQENGSTAEARNLYERVLEQRPNDIDALSGLGYCHLDQGAKGQAIATFRRALGINPSYGPAIIGLAEAYKSQGQKDQALRYYRQYLASYPSSKYSAMAERNAAQLERELKESGGAPAPAAGEAAPEAQPGGTEAAPPSADKPAAGGGEAPSADKPAAGGGEAPSADKPAAGGTEPGGAPPAAPAGAAPAPSGG